MFLIWLKFVEAFGCLKPTDTICVIVDTETKKYLDALPIKSFSYRCIEVGQPSTIQEGTQFRYRIYESGLIEDNTCVWYTDVDMLIIKDIHWLEAQIQPKSLVVYPEYSLRHFTYLGDLTEEDMIFFDEFPDVYTRHPGMTSTIFGFQGDLLKAPFEELVSKMRASTITHYTLDQPFFNRMVLWQSYKKQTFEVSFLQKNCIAYNELRSMCSPEVCLVNYCGEPGDQELHWMKMFMALLAEVVPK